MKVFIALLASLLCVGGDMHAAGTTFRSGVDLVSLNVIVTDARDKFVKGLNQDDFAVYEDGVQQDVTFFATTDVPLDLAILLDSSSSMSDRMATVQQAAIGFASHVREGDRLTVVSFRDSVRVVHPLDGDVKSATDAIRRTTAGGGTALYNALYTTIKNLAKVRAGETDVRRQAIAVLTDGEDTTSLVSADDVMALAKEAGVAIYTIALKSPFPAIGLGASKYTAESDYAMKALAQETGARSFATTDVAQLAGVYGIIAEELANQYALGYTPKNLRADGTYRHISVRVAEPNTRTRTRLGYQVTKSAE
jgi:Ca-activated chloride channel family protein